MQRYENKAENEFYEFAMASGWSVMKKGWPDFFCIRDDSIFVVEVKQPGEELSEPQEVIMEWLSSLGIHCYIYEAGHKLKEYNSTSYPPDVLEKEFDFYRKQKST